MTLLRPGLAAAILVTSIFAGPSAIAATGPLTNVSGKVDATFYVGKTCKGSYEASGRIGAIAISFFVKDASLGANIWRDRTPLARRDLLRDDDTFPAFEDLGPAHDVAVDADGKLTMTSSKDALYEIVRRGDKLEFTVDSRKEFPASSLVTGELLCHPTKT
jgi:hypothetical protein